MTVNDVKKLIERWEAIEASLSRIRMNRLRDKITELEAQNYDLTNALNRSQKSCEAKQKVNVRFVKALIPVSIIAIIEAFLLIQTWLS